MNRFAVPRLATLLAFIAQRRGVLHDGLLLFSRASGLCGPLLVAGTSRGAAQRLIASMRSRRADFVLRKTAAVIITGVGACSLRARPESKRKGKIRQRNGQDGRYEP